MWYKFIVNLHRLFLIYFVLFFIQTEGQIRKSDFIIKYKVDFQVDTTNTNSKLTEMMVLQVGDGVSLYKSAQKKETDSLARVAMSRIAATQKVTGGPVKIDFSDIPQYKIHIEVFKEDGIVKIYNHVFRDLFVFPAENKPDWKILPETKIIGNHLCKKAITRYNGRNYTAWFTTEIPISEGPYTFKGLPGLILEVYDENNWFRAELASILNKKEAITPQFRAISTDYKSFVKRRKEFNDNPVAELQRYSRTPLSEEHKRRIIENRKRRNNVLD